MFAYLLMVLGLIWVMVPYMLRDQINWFSKTTARWRGVTRSLLSMARRSDRSTHFILDINRILVIRGGALGDFILTLPALKHCALPIHRRESRFLVTRISRARGSTILRGRRPLD